MRAFNAISPYSVGMIGHDYAVFRSGQIIFEGFNCRGDAVGYAHDLLDAEEEADEAEAEEARRVEAELRADAAAILAQIGEAA
jgi:hypothetical protein